MTHLGGLTSRQVAGAIVSAFVCGAGATWAYRGHASRFLEEWYMQDSESTLNPVNKSSSKKVTKLPAASSPSAIAATTTVEAPTSSSPSSSTPSSSHPQHHDGGNNNHNQGTITLSALGNNVIGEKIQQLVTWVSENPKTAITIGALAYALQLSLRTNRAHEHYEDELLQNRRAANPTTSSSASSSSTTATGGGANNNKTKSTAAAAAAAAASSTPAVAETWATRARPEHADPEYECLLASLPQSVMEEFARTCVGIDPKEQPDLVQRVRDEVLSVAPAQGWKAVLVDNKQKLRFENRKGEACNIHTDGEFALDMIQREAKRRREEKRDENVAEQEAAVIASSS